MWKEVGFVFLYPTDEMKMVRRIYLESQRDLLTDATGGVERVPPLLREILRACDIFCCCVNHCDLR